MKIENLTEVQIAWILYHLHERMTDLIWDHYEKELLDSSRKELDRIMDEELDRLLESES
jgi:hypothetical protein